MRKSFIRSSRPTLLHIAVAVFLVAGCNRLPRRQAAIDVAPPLVEIGAEFSGPPPSDRELCMETARTVANKGHAQEAILLYEQAEKLASTEPPLDLQLAPLYAEIGDTDSAVARYRSAIARGNVDPSVANNLAWVLMDDNRFGDAEVAIQNGLANESGNKRLLTTQAILLYRTGNRDLAFSQFNSLYGQAESLHNMAILDIDRGDPTASNFAASSGRAIERMSACNDWRCSILFSNINRNWM